MSDFTDLNGLTPARLWSELDLPTREAAARALYAHAWDDGTSRRAANRAIAAALKFRDVAVSRLSADRRAGYLARSVHPDESLAYALLMALHMGERREILVTFLDALGIPQKDGLIDETTELRRPDDATLTVAVERLYAGFPEAHVRLYLTSLLAMDPGTWSGLQELLRRPAAAG